MTIPEIIMRVFFGLLMGGVIFFFLLLAIAFAMSTSGALSVEAQVTISKILLAVAGIGALIGGQAIVWWDVIDKEG